ncbi:MAG TPA: protease HtpX [Bdellovibrionales bacterium]|nr:protease HtpX [Pseudobdellovibrionaceae bacterium]HAG92256.1 protease HtpX [Bdellovibrionales bacterium]
MAIAKRIFLFVIVNILVLLTVSITFSLVMNALGLQLSGQQAIFAFYAFLGMGGAFISLGLSRIMAKTMMGVKVIDPQNASGAERELLTLVHELARKAQLPKMPEVGIYQSPEVNAFATGPTKSRSLVAVSSGLLDRMNRDEVEGVLGHEVAHIANGDMVTMTLIQGVINTLVLIVARLIAVAVSSNVDERARPSVQFGLYIVLQIVLSLLGSIVVNFFSRAREYRADAGGARLAGKDKMLASLKALGSVYGHVDRDHESLAALKISGRPAKSFAALFATHPPLAERIRALESARI